MDGRPDTVGFKPFQADEGGARKAGERECQGLSIRLPDGKIYVGVKCQIVTL